MLDAFIIVLISKFMETRCSVPYWLRMSKTTTREKLGAYDVMPACRNLKIYSTSKETPKLHLPKDRRYFSGVRDLAFGFHSDLILLLENPMEQVLSEREEAHQKLCRTDIDFDSQVSYQLKISTHSKPRSYQSQNCY